MADPMHLPKMTVDEFFAWDDGTDTRYELVNGQVRAMAAPGDSHQAILGNLIREVGNCLRDRSPCHVRVEFPVRSGEETVWQADAAVVCTAAGQQPTEAVLLIEVQSPSTRAVDLGQKLDDYKDILSVQEIWMVDSTRRRVQVWRRIEQRWIGEDYIGKGTFQSQAVGGKLFILDLIYEYSGL